MERWWCKHKQKEIASFFFFRAERKKGATAVEGTLPELHVANICFNLHRVAGCKLLIEYIDYISG